MATHHNAKQHCQNYYYKQLQERLCTYCPKPAEIGQIRCKKHIEHYKQYAKKRRINRKARGVCVICKEPAKKQYNGRTLCKTHLLKAREQRKQQEQKHKVLGLCRYCKTPIVPNKTMCQKHLDAIKKYKADRKAKLATMN